jgi:hypothetical protein
MEFHFHSIDCSPFWLHQSHCVLVAEYGTIRLSASTSLFAPFHFARLLKLL